MSEGMKKSTRAVLRSRESSGVADGECWPVGVVGGASLGGVAPGSGGGMFGCSEALAMTVMTRGGALGPGFVLEPAESKAEHGQQMKTQGSQRCRPERM